MATISKKITKGEELVVVRRSDYEAFVRWMAEIKDALAKVRRGRSEYRAKKTIVADSPRHFR